MTYQIYPAESRHSANHGWLQSNFSFSFADYYDPDNMNFGVMRVLNDDVVQPGRGFGAHPHREMEIVSIVLKGQLRHQDSTGQSATTTFGGVQRMSAGTGVIHSEMNPSDTEEVHFLQLWFEPDTPRLTPSYENTSFRPESIKGQLLPIVSKHLASDEIAYINQDLTIYLSELDSAESVEFRTDEERKLFVFVLEGSLRLNEEAVLNRRDSARITNQSFLSFQSASRQQPVRFMLIDLP